MNALNMAVQFDQLKMRERALILFAVIALLLFSCMNIFYRPLLQQKRFEQQQQSDLQVQREQLMAEWATLQARLAQRTSAPDTRVLEQELNRIEQAISEQTQNLVPPGEMTTILRNVLQQQKGIQLISLQHEPSKNVNAAATPAPTYFKHPLRLSVRGNYFDLMNYLRDLEHLRWRFQWESLHYDVQQYPSAVVSVEVATLSQEAAWLQ